MKDTPLNKAFDDAMRRFSAEPTQKQVARYLEVLQKTVQAFQEAGADATLAVRPQDKGTALKDHEDMEGEFLCNGEIVMCGTRLDFAIVKEEYYGTMDLKIFQDDDVVIARQATYDETRKRWDEEEPEDDDDAFESWSQGDRRRTAKTDLESALTRRLVEIKTRQDFAAQYSVGPASPENALQKSFSVIPALKLRKPEGP